MSGASILDNSSVCNPDCDPDDDLNDLDDVPGDDLNDGADWATELSDASICDPNSELNCGVDPGTEPIDDSVCDPNSCLLNDGADWGSEPRDDSVCDPNSCLLNDDDDPGTEPIDDSVCDPNSCLLNDGADWGSEPRDDSVCDPNSCLLNDGADWGSEPRDDSVCDPNITFDDGPNDMCPDGTDPGTVSSGSEFAFNDAVPNAVLYDASDVHDDSVLDGVADGVANGVPACDPDGVDPGTVSSGGEFAFNGYLLSKTSFISSVCDPDSLFIDGVPACVLILFILSIKSLSDGTISPSLYIPYFLK